MRSLVTGAGGFIGGHLVGRLLEDAHEVVAIDVKPQEEWYQYHDTAENYRGDVSQREISFAITEDVDQVFNLAADMGGMGFIATHKAECMLSVLSSTLVLMASHARNVDRYLYTSSACVYPDYRQEEADSPALKEDDAYPAMPEDGYGWEKLFSERMCRHFAEDFGTSVRVPRLHNVYGPYGTYDGGREKAPAAISRKIAEAVLTGRHEIDIWGDGEQTRSFMYVDDCVEGFVRLMDSQVREPINLGSDELVTINELVTIVEEIAGIEVERTYNLGAPQGVRGRCSDNTMIKDRLGWEPSITLREGMERTYNWILEEMRNKDA